MTKQPYTIKTETMDGQKYVRVRATINGKSYSAHALLRKGQKAKEVAKATYESLVTRAK